MATTLKNLPLNQVLAGDCIELMNSLPALAAVMRLRPAAPTVGKLPLAPFAATYSRLAASAATTVHPAPSDFEWHREQRREVELTAARDDEMWLALRQRRGERGVGFDRRDSERRFPSFRQRYEYELPGPSARK